MVNHVLKLINGEYTTCTFPGYYSNGTIVPYGDTKGKVIGVAKPEKQLRKLDRVSARKIVEKAALKAMNIYESENDFVDLEARKIFVERYVRENVPEYVLQEAI